MLVFALLTPMPDSFYSVCLLLLLQAKRDIELKKVELEEARVVRQHNEEYEVGHMPGSHISRIRSKMCCLLLLFWWLEMVEVPLLQLQCFTVCWACTQCLPMGIS
jgi:hypothetical protein